MDIPETDSDLVSIRFTQI